MAGIWEIKYRGLGWGTQAEVLEPAVLWEELIEEARSMARAFESGMIINEDLYLSKIGIIQH